MNANDLKEAVTRRYAEAALRATNGEGGCCGDGCGETVSSDLYDAEQLAGLPTEAAAASLGCGNPTALADLREGETVLDLGSGGGIDVFLAARRVGAVGRVYGLDMTDEMLALARENQRKAGVANVEFLKGEMEDVPLPDASVDVIVSNCVVNLSPDKDRVLAEAFRVLRPGGRLAIADVVTRGELPEDVRHSMELWAGCVAGALSEDDYRRKLAAVGFGSIEIESTRVFTAEDVLGDACCHEGMGCGCDAGLASAFVRAVKPPGS